MDIFEIVPDKLWLSGTIVNSACWDQVEALGIELVISLSGQDASVPTTANCLVYLGWLIDDGPLPDLHKLSEIARFAQDSPRILSHCAGGVNRGGLMAGQIIYELGLARGQAIVDLIRAQRPGALTNQAFATYLASLGAEG